jgi:hypothetical protein
MKTTLIAVLMLATICLAALPLMPVGAINHPADAMYIEPESFPFNTVTQSVGYEFNITVWVNITETAFGWSCGLLYPRNWLKCLIAKYTAGATSEWFSAFVGNTLPAPLVIDTSYLGNGSILAFESLLSGYNMTGPSSGSLFWAEFEIVTPPPKEGSFTSVFDITSTNPSDTWVKDPSLAKLPVTSYNSPVSYLWIPPSTEPYMGFTAPSSWPLVFGPYPPSAVGTTFTVSVAIKSLDPAWFLYNASFTLTWNSSVIDVLGGKANRTMASGWSIISESLVPGSWTFAANYTGGGSGTVAVASLLFTVLIQQTSPPYPANYVDVSHLTFSNVAFFDIPVPFGLPIPAATSETGEVDVKALISLPLPYFVVSPATTILGPSPVVGSIFSVNVNVVNLTQYWYCVEVQFRLWYDNTVLGFDYATQGPLFTNPTWDLYGTLFDAIPTPGDLIWPYPHVIVFDLLYPNLTDGMYDQPVLPNTIQTPGSPTVGTFYFTVLQQNPFGMGNITTYLNILPYFWSPVTGDECFYDHNAATIPSTTPQNGTVIIEPLSVVGRQIDLYGGAVNNGYGLGYLISTPYIQFIPPFGGQGPWHWDPALLAWVGWMDIVFPQSLVYLNANVTYNYFPVQSKDVGFEVDGPFLHVSDTGNFTADYVPAPTYQVWAKFTSTTDDCGVATYQYRMPWPCDDPDSITGVWRVTATVTIADVVVSDIIMFYYQRLVYINSVTTDSYEYSHPPDSQHPSPLYKYVVDVSVTYSTHAVLMYPALFAAVIMDNLNVPIGMATYSTMVGGATWCTWSYWEFDLYIPIPKWAYSGIGYVQVSVYDKDPTLGGEPLLQMFPLGPFVVTPWLPVWTTDGVQIDIAAE